MRWGRVLGGGPGARAQSIPLSRLIILLAPLAAVHFGHLATTAGAHRAPASWIAPPAPRACLPQVGRWKYARTYTRALPRCNASLLSVLPAHACGQQTCMHGLVRLRGGCASSQGGGDEEAASSSDGYAPASMRAQVLSASYKSIARRPGFTEPARERARHTHTNAGRAYGRTGRGSWTWKASGRRCSTTQTRFLRSKVLVGDCMWNYTRALG